MAVQQHPIKVEKTRGNQGVWYEMDGGYYVRGMSTLSKETVLTHPRFVTTRQYAAGFRIAAKLAARTFRSLHSTWKTEEVQEKLTSIACQVIYTGGDPEEVPGQLMQFLATCGYHPDITYSTIPDSDKQAMKDLRKALKAARRKELRALRRQVQVAVIPVIQKPVSGKKLRIARGKISREDAEKKYEVRSTKYEGKDITCKERFACINTGIHKKIKGRKGKATVPV